MNKGSLAFVVAACLTCSVAFEVHADDQGVPENATSRTYSDSWTCNKGYLGRTERAWKS